MQIDSDFAFSFTAFTCKILVYSAKVHGPRSLASVQLSISRWAMQVLCHSYFQIASSLPNVFDTARATSVIYGILGLQIYVFSSEFGEHIWYAARICEPGANQDISFQRFWDDRRSPEQTG